MTEMYEIEFDEKRPRNGATWNVSGFSSFRDPSALNHPGFVTSNFQPGEWGGIRVEGGRGGREGGGISGACGILLRSLTFLWQER